MIRSFASKATAAVYAGKFVSSLPREIQQAAFRKLEMLDAAAVLEDLRAPPANRLEALRADRQGQWSIRINDQWRICFRFGNGDVYEAEITDYH